MFLISRGCNIQGEQLNLFTTPFGGVDHSNLGDTVWYKPAIKDGMKVGPLFPAIIHKIHKPNSGGKNLEGVVGIHIFTEHGPERMNYVRYGTGEGEWRRREDGFTDKDTL